MYAIRSYYAAVEENIGYLNPPVLSVFKAFTYRIKMIDPDIVSALLSMRGQIDNAVFHERNNFV